MSDPPTEAPPVPPVTRLIDLERVRAYAQAARDPNPLHTDPAFAARTEFGRPIAHGMLVLALLSEALSGAFGARWAASGRLKVRWRAPAVMPVEVTARAQPVALEGTIARYDVRCEAADGTVLLTGTAACDLAVPVAAPAGGDAAR